MNAYDVLKKFGTVLLIDENRLNQIKDEFEKDYLSSKMYFEKKAKHRNPDSVSSEFLHELNSYLLKMQNRPEMRDFDPEKNIGGYVNVVINDIWESDRSLTSHFQAIHEYCKLRAKDFNSVAIHFAEYDALRELYWKIKMSPTEENKFNGNQNYNMYNLFITNDEGAWEG